MASQNNDDLFGSLVSSSTSNANHKESSSPNVVNDTHRLQCHMVTNRKIPLKTNFPVGTYDPRTINRTTGTEKTCTESPDDYPHSESFGTSFSLRLPFESYGLFSGVAASTTSLLVHAPSTSRFSGKTDDDDISLGTDADGTSFTNLTPDGSNCDADILGCPLCCTGLYGHSRSGKALRQRFSSSGMINTGDLANSFRYSLETYCDMHRKAVMNVTSFFPKQSSSTDLPRKCAISNSLPNLRHDSLILAANVSDERSADCLEQQTGDLSIVIDTMAGDRGCTHTAATVCKT